MTNKKQIVLAVLTVVLLVSALVVGCTKPVLPLAPAPAPTHPV